MIVSPPNDRSYQRITRHLVTMTPSGDRVWVKVVRSSRLARVLHAVTGMEAITPWFTVHVVPPAITVRDLEHEFEHARQIYRRCPVVRGRRVRALGVLRFAIEYLTLLALHGYDKHPLEQAARRVAGQPTR